MARFSLLALFVERHRHHHVCPPRGVRIQPCNCGHECSDELGWSASGVFLLWQVACVARFNGQICLCLETTDNDTLPRTENSSLRAKCLLHRSFTPRSAARACGKTSSYHNGVTICLHAQKI